MCFAPTYVNDDILPEHSLEFWSKIVLDSQAPRDWILF